LQIAAEAGAAVLMNGVRYEGRLTLVRLDDHRVQAVHELPLEAYLVGVVSAEMDSRWPLETLKAQAIVARTMTWRQIADRAGQAFDVTMRWPQRYEGPPAHQARARQAVEATRGLVVTVRGALVPTYYHTVCGGHTADARQVWPTQHQVPWRGVPCRFCRRAPHVRWRLALTDERLADALQQQGITVGSVRTLTFGPRDASGRVADVAVTGTQGTTTIPMTSFREALGPNHLRSTRCWVRRQGTQWVFDGVGWGHGVGLCQWGAMGLGQRRQTAEQILARYYPGATVVSHTP